MKKNEKETTIEKKEPKTFFARINPIFKDIALNGAKGYVFGSFVGLINSRKELGQTIKDMHRSGTRFMALGMLYTGSESLIENIREKKDSYNALGASAMAGGILLGKQGIKKAIFGAFGFSVYTGLNHFTFDDHKN